MISNKMFKKGDKVRMRRTVCFDYITFEKGCVGEVTSGETNRGFCCVKMTNAENGKMTEHFICTNNLELIDCKTAFLSELKGLLEKYDAKISAYSVGYDGELDLTFDVGNCEVLYSEDNPIFKGHSVHTITADNIMDYDKE